MQMNQDLLNSISVILTAVFTAVGTVVAKYYNEKKAYAKAQASQIANEQDAQLANQAINEVDDLIRTNIIAVENTLKKGIIDGIANGDYSRDALKNLSVNVLNQVKNQMSISSMSTLENIRKDVDGYLANRIEGILTVLKNDRNVSVSRTIIPLKKATEATCVGNGSTESPIQMETLAGADCNIPDSQRGTINNSGILAK